MRTILAICLGFLMVTPGISAEITSGTATVHDGDDLILHGQDYRLNGIDAFEYGQTCRTPDGRTVDLYKGAIDALSKLINGKTVSCSNTGERSRERLIGRCSIGSISLEKEMIRSGWALVRKDYARERIRELCAIEAEARTAKRGAWQCANFAIPYFEKGGTTKSAERILCREDFGADGVPKRN